MYVQKSEVLPILTEMDIVKVRQYVRDWSLECKFGKLDLTKFVTAASELARNTLTYGLGGEATLERIQDGARDGLRLAFSDRGPGIPNVTLALTDGYTTGGGMGLGLSGAKRLVHEFELSTQVGEGTTITITRWRT
jgi:serine/threonine-protein kinase RsbT